MPTLTNQHTCACGSQAFMLTESISWKATTEGGTGKLTVYRVTGNEIDEIVCASCGAAHTVDEFDEIDFS